jgi:hypothetical protein
MVLSVFRPGLLAPVVSLRILDLTFWDGLGIFDDSPRRR